MEHLHAAEQARNVNMMKLRELNERTERGEEVETFQQPVIPIECVYYLKITTYFKDKDNRAGYVVDVDPCNSNNLLGARYFLKTGQGTYREASLTYHQFKDLVTYYKLNKLDSWYVCHEAVK